MGSKEFLKKSGRRDSNPRHSAWEADILPLNYARKKARIFFCKKSIRFLCFLSIHLFWPNCARVPGKLFFASGLYSGSDDPQETYLRYSVSPLVHLYACPLGDALRWERLTVGTPYGGVPRTDRCRQESTGVQAGTSGAKSLCHSRPASPHHGAG